MNSVHMLPPLPKPLQEFTIFTRQVVLRLFCFIAGIVISGVLPASAETFNPRQLVEILDSHDPVWTKSPGRWFDGAPLGNGDIGVVAWSDGHKLVFTLDKSDLWEKRNFEPDPGKYNWKRYREILAEKYAANLHTHTAEELRDFQRPRRKPLGTLDQDTFEPPYVTRLPLGRLEIPFSGELQDFTMRLRLGTARLEGSVVTSTGTMTWSAYVHAQSPLVVFEWETTGNLEAKPTVRFVVDDDSYTPKIRDHLRSWGYPAPVRSQDGDISSVTEAMPAGGEYAVSSRFLPPTAADGDKRTLLLAICHSRNDRTAHQDTVQRLRSAHAPSALAEGHASWWAQYYPASFLSIPDTRLEALYWLEMYRLGAGTRPDQLPLALEGPWTVDGEIMPRFAGSYYWNVNTQETYWPIYTANRLKFGESLYRMIDAMRPELRRFTRQFFGIEGEFLRIGTDPYGGSTYMSPSVVVEFNGLPWVAHHYWLHYRYTLDTEFLRTRAVPLMKAALAPYLAELRPGPDGHLHLEFSESPEYVVPGQARWGPDATIDLALIRGLCSWLLEADSILDLNDPDRAKWQATLGRLTPYPVDKNGGLAIRADQDLTASHRHHSHLMPIYPLKLISLDSDPELIQKSISNWKFRGTGEWTGWSYGWAASIAAHTGQPQLARTLMLDYVDHFVSTSGLHMDGVRDNSFMTIWQEHDVLTLEAGFGVANALQETLLQSHDDVIRIFPATAWSAASFWSLRAEGAFLVSARRDRGLLEFAEIKSLKGGSCQVLLPDDGAGLEFTLNDQAVAPERSGRLLRFATKPGDTIVLALPGTSRQIVPLQPVDSELHHFGTKRTEPARWSTSVRPSDQPQ